MRKWTQEEIDFLKNHIDDSLVLSKFNKKFEPRSFDAVTRKIRRVKRDLDRNPTQTQGSLVEQKPPQIGSTRLKEFIREVEDELSSLKPRTFNRVKSNRNSLCILLSDLHFGKQTDFFNFQVASDRIASIPDKLGDLSIDLTQVDEVRLLLGGDLIEGEGIYVGQNNYIEASAIDQTMACAQALIKLATTLSTIFPKVVIDMVPGNHGRIDKMANMRSNWDNVIGAMIKLAVDTLGLDIETNMQFDRFNVLEIKDKRILLYHHGTKHMGTPAMKIKLAGWILSKDIEALCHGHWHQYEIGSYHGRPSIKNGSLCGSDDLSEQIAEDEPARQAVFLVEPGKPLRTFTFLEWR